MTKAELESKHIAELHALAAEAGIPRYRMLRREELIGELLDGKPAPSAKPAAREKPQAGERRERPPRRRRERPARQPARPEPAAGEPAPAAPEPSAPASVAPPAPAERPRRRRRRRFGRKSKGLGIHDLLLSPPGRQALVYGEDRAACTALLREIAAQLAGESKDLDPIALLVDPSPEELAEWKREAPQAELVAASQVRHASDALAQAVRRAEAGEEVVLLVDSLTRIEDADAAKEIFDAGLGLAATGGSLTVVAALERSS